MEFTDIKLSVDELVTKIGAQLGAVEEVIDLGKKYQGIVVARVVKCHKHPNADKLSVCTIDDGGITPDVKRDDNNYIQVVCGAPNVRTDMLVAWLPPGVIVPSTFDKNPYALESREIRGELSSGMLASAHELAIGDDHDGILEIDLPANPGANFADIYELNDYIIDIENKMFTHRPDCFGILGVAREISGILGKQFMSPEWYKLDLDKTLSSPDQITSAVDSFSALDVSDGNAVADKTGTSSADSPWGRSILGEPSKSAQNQSNDNLLKLDIKNTIPDLVPRFMAVAISNVNLKKSPFIIQTYLSRVGLKPINNIVDITNYMMYLTGQPTHAYDYDKLQKLTQNQSVNLETRMSKKDETIRLLGGKQISFDDDKAILVTSNNVPVGIGGVMGGADTEVDINTKNIVIECANFDMYSIRRTSMKYGLFTDAVTRFNKGQSKLQNDVVLDQLISMVISDAGGQVASEIFGRPTVQNILTTVETTVDFVNDRLGSKLSDNQIVAILKNVEFDVHIDNNLVVTSPFWRTDIAIAEDIVEEVGRLYGYDKLPLLLPQRSLKPAIKDTALLFKQKVREILSKAGANELLTYNFTSSKLLEQVGLSADQAYKLSNALSPELQYFRMSLTPSLLDKIHANIKAGASQLAIYEINKVHSKMYGQDNQDLPKELSMLALVVAVDKSNLYAGAPYFQARTYMDYIGSQLGLIFSYEPVQDLPKTEQPIAQPFEASRSAQIIELTSKTVLGVVGEYKQSVTRALKLPAFCAGFEINIEQLQALQKDTKNYLPLSRYPGVWQDISLKVPSNIKHGDLQTFIEQNINVPSTTKYQVLPIDIYQNSNQTEFMQMTFRLIVTSYIQTMTDLDVNQILEDLALKTKQEFNTERL